MLHTGVVGNGARVEGRGGEGRKGKGREGKGRVDGKGETLGRSCWINA